MNLLAPINITQTCQACGAPLTDSDWLCADCREEPEQDDEPATSICTCGEYLTHFGNCPICEPLYLV